MDETIPHEPCSSENTPRATGRYTFASGSRPLEGYTLKRAIGRGGFGEVYYATSDAGKEVAIKLITRNLEVERRGVVQCMNLKNPHLVAIHDLRSNDEGDTFVIMEYIAGPSLANILEKHPEGLPLEDVRHWLKGLVEGVSYLHDHGIVHRDLKPANLFLEEGVVKIGDHGLSKAITQSREPGHSESVGTCHYMAPEISTGKYHKPIDIYAIGVILYELITGRVPFDGESVGEILMKHLTSRPDLSPLPEPYRSIIRRALAKDPNHRPQRAEDLLPPGDAPRSPEVRFIAENREDASRRPTEDEVLRIEAEEPVLYIGPDTVPEPPRRCARFQNRASRASARIARASRAAASSLRRQPGNRSRPAPTPAPPESPRVPVPPSPVLPSGRIRVAELAGSMLLTAPLAALATVLSVLAFDVVGQHHPQDPGQLALLFGTTLLGTWGVLGASKHWEGKPASGVSRRVGMFGLGAGLGLVSGFLAEWAYLGGPPGWPLSGPPNHTVFVGMMPLSSPGALPVNLAIFFGLSFAALRLWKLSARDRKSRFRFWPVAVSGLVASLVGLFVPAPQAWGLFSVAIIAILVQLVSPWSAESAAYRQYQQALKRGRAA